MYACPNVHVLGPGERGSHHQAEQESLFGRGQSAPLFFLARHASVKNLFFLYSIKLSSEYLIQLCRLDACGSSGTEVRRAAGGYCRTRLAWDNRLMPGGRKGRVVVPAFSCVQIWICIVLYAFNRD